jgi:type IV pilus assembly protein PilA
MSTPPSWPPPPPPPPAPPQPPPSGYVGGPPAYGQLPSPKKSISPIIIVLIVLAAVFGGIMVIGIIAAIAIPGLLRARMSANEASAIGAMRAMVSAQTVWISTHNGGPALPSCLGDPASCGDPQSTRYLDASVASLQPRSGYDFGFVLRPGDEEPTADPAGSASATHDRGGFAYWASPTTFGSTGSRRFCVDETGVVREYDRGAPWTPPSDAEPRCPDTGRPLQ